MSAVVNVAFDKKNLALLGLFCCLAFYLALRPLWAQDALTPVGAIKAGNADGTIPAWTGGLTNDQAPKFDSTVGFIDPFANDQPKFRITSSNYKTHADKLSSGHTQLLERYPSYFMDVYHTRRTAAYPQAIYDAAIANDGSATLNGDTLTNAKLSIPFRQPTTGEQVIMNHKLRYQGDAVTRLNHYIVVEPNGKQRITLKKERILNNFGNISQSNPAEDDQLLFYSVSKVIAPPKDVGQIILIHEYLNPMVDNTGAITRNAWLYGPGRRPLVYRPPTIAFDYKPLGTDGQMFVDQADMFNGFTGHYTWTLLGLQEFYIPYNSYKLADKSLTYTEILPAKHMNQLLARYELHRVWMVAATLSQDADHSIGQRVFYVDEDSWGIVMVDVYDKAGNLWRFQEGHAIQFYGQGDVMFTSTTPEIIYDFANGKYFASKLDQQEKMMSFDNPDFEKKMFQANYMKKIK